MGYGNGVVDWTPQFNRVDTVYVDDSATINCLRSTIQDYKAIVADLTKKANDERIDSMALNIVVRSIIKNKIVLSGEVATEMVSIATKMCLADIKKRGMKAFWEHPPNFLIPMK